METLNPLFFKYLPHIKVSKEACVICVLIGPGLTIYPFLHITVYLTNHL